MIEAATLLLVLSAQPKCWADRKVAPEVKAAQYETIATAVAAASSTPERAAMLLTIGYHEGRWCLRVGSGAKRGGKGEGYWQLEGSHHGDGARSGLSLEAVTSAAALASAQLDKSGQCGSSPAAVLTAYAGRPCWQREEWTAYHPDTGRVRFEGWPTLDARVKGYWWALTVLRKAGVT